jgi:hypothetical protein
MSSSQFLSTVNIDRITAFDNGIVAFFNNNNIVYSVKYTDVPDLFFQSKDSQPTIQWLRQNGEQFNLNIGGLLRIDHKGGTINYSPLPPINTDIASYTERCRQIYYDLIFFVFVACCECDCGDGGGGTVTSVNATVELGANAVSFTGVPFTDFGTIQLNFLGDGNQIIQGDGTLGFRQKRIQWVWDDEIIAPYNVDTQVVRFTGSGIQSVTEGTYTDGNPMVTVTVSGSSGGSQNLQQVLDTGNTAYSQMNLLYTDGGDSFFYVDPIGKFIGIGDFTFFSGGTHIRVDDDSRFIQFFALNGYYFYDYASGFPAVLKANNLTSGVDLQIPNNSGTFALSVNGNFADVSGNITLDAGGAAWGSIGAGTGVSSQTDLVNYLNANYIPLSGTVTGSPVTGNIKVFDGFGLLYDGDPSVTIGLQVASDSSNLVYNDGSYFSGVSLSSNLGINSVNLSTGDQTSLLFNPDTLRIIVSGSTGFKGITYQEDYQDNYIDRSLVDKGFVTTFKRDFLISTTFNVIGTGERYVYGVTTTPTFDFGDRNQASGIVPYVKILNAFLYLNQDSIATGGSLTATLYKNGSPTSVQIVVPFGSANGKYVSSNQETSDTINDYFYWVVENNLIGVGAYISQLGIEVGF